MSTSSVDPDRVQSQTFDFWSIDANNDNILSAYMAALTSLKDIEQRLTTRVVTSATLVGTLFVWLFANAEAEAPVLFSMRMLLAVAMVWFFFWLCICVIRLNPRILNGKKNSWDDLQFIGNSKEARRQTVSEWKKTLSKAVSDYQWWMNSAESAFKTGFGGATVIVMAALVSQLYYMIQT